MAEKDTFKLTKTARKPMNICWDCFRKTEQRHGFMTWTVGNYNVQYNFYQFDKNEKKKYITHIAYFKNYKYVGWLTIPFVQETQTSNKYEGQTYMTLVFYRTHPP